MPATNQDSSNTPSPDRPNDRRGQRQGYCGFSTSQGSANSPPLGPAQKRCRVVPYTPRGSIDPVKVIRVMEFAPNAASRKQARQKDLRQDFMAVRGQTLTSMVASAERLHSN